MSIWIQITSGRGPIECCQAVAKVVPLMVAEAREAGFCPDIVEYIPGDQEGTAQSVLLSLPCDQVPAFINTWLGTIQWISESQFRPNHKRKNWFIGVQCVEQPPKVEYRDREIRFETFRASGPGGQNVNKVESAVRATHLPTGISVSAQEARSQYANRQLALQLLKRRLQLQADCQKEQTQQQLWHDHSTIERGNPVRVYSGRNFNRLR